MSAPVVAGVGIHSGARCEVRLHRVDGPLRARRGRVEIPLDLDHVVATAGATVLGRAGARVGVVEHLLAALTVHGFRAGVLVEADADELPILDGSAAPWTDAVLALGTPPPAPAPRRVETPFEWTGHGGRVRLEPGRPELDVRIEFAHPAIGAQAWRGGPTAWGEVLDARTFGFLADLERLRASGRAAGAGPGNAIVFGDDGPAGPLRHPDEPARHKALDALGDLALLGAPIEGRVRIDRGSHALHVSAARAWRASLTREPLPTQPPPTRPPPTKP